MKIRKLRLYRDYEGAWLKKYRSRFSESPRREEFRQKIQEYMLKIQSELNLNFEEEKG